MSASDATVDDTAKCAAIAPYIDNDEASRKILKPNPSVDAVLAVLQKTYPNVPISIIKELESYDDRNFCISFDSELCLAKIFNGVESSKYLHQIKSMKEDTISHAQKDETATKLSSIELYDTIFTHLKQPKYQIQSSSPILKSYHVDFPDTADCPIRGRSIHNLPVTGASLPPRPLVLQLLHWVPGHTMASLRTPLPVHILADAGRYLGRVCIALDDLTEEDENARNTADRYHAWDGRHTLDLEKYLYCIGDDDGGGRRGLVQSVLDAFKTELVEGKDGGGPPDFRMGILQGDFNDANIIMDDGGNVTGVIDFCDATLSWRVLDISIAMAYATLSTYGKTNHSFSAAAAMLRGFHSIYPLTDTEKRHLRLLVAARLSCSVTLGAYSYSKNPDNQYLLLHAEPAWKALELIWGDGGGVGDVSSEIDSLFDVACSVCPLVATHDATGEEIDEISSSSSLSTSLSLPIINCTDISFPDPNIVDIFQSVRQKKKMMGIEPTTERLLKKARTATLGDLNNGDHDPVITFVTGNEKKLEEVKRILSSSSSTQTAAMPFTIANRKIDLPELQGDPLEIAKEKCSIAAQEINGPAITDNTSLSFTALNGMPGPYIKWFLESCGHDGLNCMIAFSTDKSACAQTMVGFCPGPGEEVVVFDGRTQGKIVPGRGLLDFGWDPIFEPDEGGGLTYAEMAKAAKDAISHRSRAFGKLRHYLVKEGATIKAKLERA